MKLSASLLTAALAVSLTPAIASASNIIIDSNSSTVTYNGFSNGWFTIPAHQSTVNLSTGIGSQTGVWASPITGSNWVSYAAGTEPGGNVIAPAGTYFYSSTFTDTDPADSSGTISVMADDTVYLFLNGHAIGAPTSLAPAAHCIAAEPNCEEVATYLLPTGDFISGTNTLSFDVVQLYGSATGLDFVANIDPTPTPEPSSLLLLATGLAGTGVILRQRTGQRVSA